MDQELHNDTCSKCLDPASLQPLYNGTTHDLRMDIDDGCVKVKAPYQRNNAVSTCREMTDTNRVNPADAGEHGKPHVHKVVSKSGTKTIPIEGIPKDVKIHDKLPPEGNAASDNEGTNAASGEVVMHEPKTTSLWQEIYLREEDARAKFIAQPSSRLLSLPLDVRLVILLEVLDDHIHGRQFHIEYAETFPVVFGVCRQLRREMRHLWTLLPLRITEPLPEAVDQHLMLRRYGVRTIFGKERVNELCVTAPVIHAVEAQTLLEFSYMILGLPGLDMGSRVMIPNISEQAQVDSLVVYTMHDTAELVALYGPQSSRGYSITFSPTNHANLFGWPRFCALKITSLRVQIENAYLWDDYQFEDGTDTYRALPITALIASIIAMRPFGMKFIVLANLGDWHSLFQDMWESIPRQTPLHGVDPILDQLIAYPFADNLDDIWGLEFGDAGTKSAAKGNLFGVKTVLQWQAFILKARHGPSTDPQWIFEQ